MQQKFFNDVFEQYPEQVAPFMHEQYHDWLQTRPLQGLRVLHHVPLVTNVLLKIACLHAAGAKVTATNPDFMTACPAVLQKLASVNIPFASDINQLSAADFDIYLDCGAALYQALGAPSIGVVELTGTGDNIFRQLTPACPIISIDRTLTKQLETVFGAADSVVRAIVQLTGKDLVNPSWCVVGFGKIGRGIAYLCEQNHWPLTVIDSHMDAVQSATELNIHAINSDDTNEVQAALAKATIIVTATGSKDVLKHWPKTWFNAKLLVNMGILDEYGPRFSEEEVLYRKQPINFLLKDPTAIYYIDPEMYAHNQTVLDLLQPGLKPGMHDMRKDADRDIIARWSQHHPAQAADIQRWFVQTGDKS